MQPPAAHAGSGSGEEGTPWPRQRRFPPAHATAASVRPARPADARALAALSEPFVRLGALRERPLGLYALHAADFLVVGRATTALSTAASP